MFQGDITSPCIFSLIVSDASTFEVAIPQGNTRMINVCPYGAHIATTYYCEGDLLLETSN